jgi:hypothetical protein
LARKGYGRIVIPLAIALVVVGIALIGFYLLTEYGGPQGGEFKTHTNEKYSYKFDYPAGWGTDNYGLEIFLAFDYNQENGPDLRMAQIKLEVDDNAEWQFGISLEDNLSGYISGIENEYENALIGKPTEVIIDNHIGIKWSYRYSLYSLNFRNQVEVVVKENYMYWLEMGTLEENYPYYEPIFQHVIDSFTFLD